MKIADIRIVESLNQPAPWKWTDKSVDTFNANASISAPDDLIVTLEDIGNDTWVISFSREQQDGRHTTVASGQGDEFKVFATVVDIISKWWKEISWDGYRPDEIGFSASKQEGDSPRRAKLYARFAQKFANQIGYDMKIKNRDRSDMFVLINPDA